MLVRDRDGSDRRCCGPGAALSSGSASGPPSHGPRHAQKLEDGSDRFAGANACSGTGLGVVRHVDDRNVEVLGSESQIRPRPDAVGPVA